MIQATATGNSPDTIIAAGHTDSARPALKRRASMHELVYRVSIAEDFILRSYNKKITLDEAADHACLSINHFIRTFKKVFNKSPHQYLIDIRIQHAKNLLLNTDHTLHEIVHMVGLDSASSFIRTFRSKHGITPSAYRNTMYLE